MASTPEPPQNPDLILAATLFLMTQYALTRRAPIGRGVVDHLKRLMAFTDVLSPRLLLALPGLRDQWAAVSGDARQRASRGVVVPFRAVRR
jgi:hypothetical protein